MTLVGHCCHCKEPVETWIASVTNFDPSITDTAYWRLNRKRLQWGHKQDRFFNPWSYIGHQSYPRIWCDTAKYMAEHVGYGFSWNYYGWSQENQNDPLELTPPVRFTTRLVKPLDFNGVGFGKGQQTGINGLTTQAFKHNTFSFLTVHYGRPVYSRTESWHNHNPASGGINWVEYSFYGSQFYGRPGGSRYRDNVQLAGVTPREASWGAQLKAATVQHCGYKEAIPGDFLVGVLPLNHWTRPKGIKKIRIWTEATSDFYYGDVTPPGEEYWALQTTDWGSIEENPSITDWDNWHELMNWPSMTVSPWPGRERVSAINWGFGRYGRRLSGIHQADTKQPGSGARLFKYRVYLGDVEITAEPDLSKQAWTSTMYGVPRELEIAIPEDYEYTGTEQIDVDVYFRQDRNRSTGSRWPYPKGEAGMHWGHNGLGNRYWPRIECVYDVEHDITEWNRDDFAVSIPSELWVGESAKATEGVVLPLSGRLAIRYETEFPGHPAFPVIDVGATPPHTLQIVTGFFPAGNDHVETQQTIDENDVLAGTHYTQYMQHAGYRHVRGDPWHAFGPVGHWRQETMQFEEHMITAPKLGNGSGGGLSDTIHGKHLQSADQFVPIPRVQTPRRITVEPLEN